MYVLYIWSALYIYIALCIVYCSIENMNIMTKFNGLLLWLYFLVVLSHIS